VIYRLADRLHKTPQEIRESFTLDDFDHFLAHCQMTADEARG
jgi:hypothetical protein